MLMLFLNHLERKEQMMSDSIYLELIDCLMSHSVFKYSSLWADWQIINMIWSINVSIPHSLIFLCFIPI